MIIKIDFCLHGDSFQQLAESQQINNLLNRIALCNIIKLSLKANSVHCP